MTSMTLFSGAFVVKFEQILHIAFVFPLFTLNRYMLGGKLHDDVALH